VNVGLFEKGWKTGIRSYFRSNKSGLFTQAAGADKLVRPGEAISMDDRYDPFSVKGAGLGCSSSAGEELFTPIYGSFEMVFSHGIKKRWENEARRKNP
jgi:hypothetical protein